MYFEESAGAGERAGFDIWAIKRRVAVGAGAIQGPGARGFLRFVSAAADALT
jgi:hypothetical protein